MIHISTHIPLVFDLDGTLIDSAPGITEAVNGLLAPFGRPPLSVAAVTLMIGEGSTVLLERAQAATGGALSGVSPADLMESFLRIYEALPYGPNILYPGVAETLARLQRLGHPLGLCTNKPGRVTDQVLRDIGIRAYFDAVAGGDTQPWRKPDSRHVLDVIRKLGRHPLAGAIMVGDSINDIQPARALGIGSVAVAYGYSRLPVPDLGANVVIQQFSELPAAIAQIMEQCRSHATVPGWQEPLLQDS